MRQTKLPHIFFSTYRSTYILYVTHTYDAYMFRGKLWQLCQLETSKRVVLKFYFLYLIILVYCMFNAVALDSWFSIDNCCLIGWNQKNPAGIRSEWTRSSEAAALGDLPRITLNVAQICCCPSVGHFTPSFSAVLSGTLAYVAEFTVRMALKGEVWAGYSLLTMEWVSLEICLGAFWYCFE